MSSAITPLDPAAARARIEDVRELPTPPEVAARVGTLVEDPRAGASDLGELVTRDPALTAAALRVVNSAYYGLERRIGNASRAMVVLGFERVKTVARQVADRSSANGGAFDEDASEGGGVAEGADSDGDGEDAFDPTGLWVHSIATGIAARELALRVAPNWAEDAFAAGLLHDVGKLALSVAYPKRWTAIVAEAERDGVLHADVERRHLGFDHAAAGGWLAEKWRFPQPLAQAIAHHHTPGAAREARELVAVVHVADVLVRSLGIGDASYPVPPVDAAAWERMAIDGQTELEEFLAAVLAAFDSTSALLEGVARA